MTYRVGIVGAGFGEKTHLPSFVAHPDFEPVAIASPTSAAKIAKARNLAGFSTLKEMLAGEQLDVVSIASPPFTHHEDVLLALEAGKHVICEKPFTLNVGQAEELVAAQKRAGTACAVMHEFRWVPQRQALKELIANGHLAPMREIEITQLAGFLRADATRRGNWWFNKEQGGGLAGALLSHLIDTATWLAGRYPVSSTGMLRNANPARHDDEHQFTSTVDDGAFAVIDYGDGLIARVSADATVAVESVTIAAHAENRTAVSSGPSMVEMRLFAVDADETSELDCAPMKYAKFASVNGNVPLVLELLDEFVKQIKTGKSQIPTFEDALHTQRVLESIGYSA
ncbi:MAG: Gfo/Idh/MocA family oxidoreductase [Candidatus Eremiobacteraeota bacterium]|nr:Gfo/Idh/MocA family oxidoreductase [Candidatus Eremiobacteraeota bacterium]